VRDELKRTPFDILGFLCACIGLTSLLYGLSDANTDGWGSTKVMGFLLVGVLLLVVFVIVELRLASQDRQPLLDMRVFSNAAFTTSNITSILVTFALYGGLFIIPIYLQTLRGLSAFQAGLLLLPQAFASMAAAVIGGRLVDRFGVRPVVIPGLIALGIALWLFTSIGPNTPYGTIQLWLIGRSLALGFCFQPLAVSALSEIVPRRLPQATAVNTTVRFVMSSFAVAVMATLVQSQTAIHFSHLAEMVTPASLLGQLVPKLQALFIQRGASASTAYATAIQVIAGLVQRQATILAMQDAFRFSVILTGVAIIAAFFVRYRRVPPPTEQLLSEQQRSEETAAREEAKMAI
jgi:EmrB/QacA subfamily drug resistance transporter